MENTSTPRNHKAESQRKTATALAKAIGVNRGAVEQANLIQSANRNAARAEAARGNDNAAKTREAKTVDPQVVGQLFEEPPPTRDHAKKHAKSSSTALAKAIGVNRGAVD